MLRGVALTIGLLAAAPAFAGEMNAEEARRFVVGKKRGNGWKPTWTARNWPR
jgi:hypothetical protein